MDKQLINNDINNNDVSRLLKEFCRALEDEIKAIKKKASSRGVYLSNGKRIDTNAGQYQYLFSIEDTLNYPDDSPLQFILPGKMPMISLLRKNMLIW